MVLTGANVHDSKAHQQPWTSLIIARPPATKVEQHACEDKAYDSKAIRQWLTKRGYGVHIPR